MNGRRCFNGILRLQRQVECATHSSQERREPPRGRRGHHPCAAMLLADLLIVAVGHLDVCEETQSGVFVITTVLAAIAQALEVMVLAPKVPQAHSTT